MLRSPATRLAALRFLRLAIPPRFVNEGLSYPVTPDSGRMETTGSPTFLGKPQFSSAHVQATPVGPAPLAISKCRHGPRSAHDEGSQPLCLLSGLSSMALELAVYASSRLLPSPTQDSLPGVVQTFLHGLLPARLPTKGFQAYPYISSPFPKH